jgi:hypothetical protein
MKSAIVRGAIWFFACLILILMELIPIQAESQMKVKTIKNKLIQLVESNDKASPKVKQFIKTHLIPQMTNPVFVTYVEKQNKSGMTMADISKIDEEWKAAEDFLDIHEQMLSGACADEVKRVSDQFKAIGETFVMDNQGANVCQNELTGDYWQGDEAKWKNSYNEGVGGVDIGTEKLDRSTNMVLQQVSIPIVAKNGQVIGAICFGLVTDKI